jgi:hypothetical protein
MNIAGFSIWREHALEDFNNFLKLIFTFWDETICVDLDEIKFKFLPTSQKKIILRTLKTLNEHWISTSLSTTTRQN